MKAARVACIVYKFALEFNCGNFFRNKVFTHKNVLFVSKHRNPTGFSTDYQ